jgi:hypothetical protein
MFSNRWPICGLRLRFIRMNKFGVKNLLWARVSK